MAKESKDDKLSFLPEDYVAKRVELRTNLICLSLFAVVLAAVIGAYIATSRHRAEIREQRALVNEEYAEAARRLEQLDELQRRKAKMLRKAQVTGTLLEPVPRTFLLADLINRMPPTLSIFDLKLTSEKKRVKTSFRRDRSALANRKQAKTGKDQEGKPLPPPPPQTIVDLVMIGVAPTDVQVAQYMTTLARSELLSEVNLVYSEESVLQDTTLRRFRIEMRVDPEADMRRIEPVERPRLKGNPMDTQSASALERASRMRAAPAGGTIKKAGDLEQVED